MSKFVRYYYDNKVFFGRLDGQKIVRLTGDFLDPDTKEDGTTVDLDKVCLLSPVAPKNVLCIGLNYKSHAEESEMELPDHPLIFLKTTTAVTGPGAPVFLPLMAPDNVDYEGELVVVIGKRAKNVSEEDAYKYIFGYTIGNDVSARDCQLHQDTQWARGKSFDTFCPIGPFVETELDPLHLSIRTTVNGNVMQDSDTDKMIFNVPQLVSFCSRAMTLEPGTVILTGTPEGVGFSRIPPVWLREGDTVKIEIEGLGALENRIMKEQML